MNTSSRGKVEERTDVNVLPLTAEEAIADDNLQEYKRIISFFAGEAFHLRLDVFIIEQILQFPFPLFTQPDDRWFFSEAYGNSFDVAMLIVTRLLHDTGESLCPLLPFRDRMMKELIKPKYKPYLRERLKQAKFDRRMEEAKDKAVGLRNARIAHVQQEFVEQMHTDRVLLGDLWALRDGVIALIDALSFNARLCVGPPGYDPDICYPEGQDQRTDIERLLDSVAAQSDLLNYPERYPAQWPNRRASLTEDQLREFNRYRKKLGLPQR